MKIAKIFQNGQSQAVRLPKEFRFNSDEVFIKKVGETTVLFPIENPWASLKSSLDKFSKDFMDQRKQPPQQKRDDIFK